MDRAIHPIQINGVYYENNSLNRSITTLTVSDITIKQAKMKIIETLTIICKLCK